MSRVEDLEDRAARLQSELDRLLDDYVQVKRQLRTLEAAQAGATTVDSDGTSTVGRGSGEWPDWSGTAAGRDVVSSTPPSEEHPASQAAVDAAVREVETDEERRADDIIVG